MSRYRWTILALGTAAQASYSAVFIGLPVLAPEFQREYELGLTEVGLVLAAVNAGAVVTLLPWGLLTDRIGERAVLAAGLGGAAAALAGAAFAPGLGLLAVAITLGGAAGASVNAASGRAVMGWFAPTQRGLALGIRQTAVPLGGAAAALVLPPVVAAGGLRAGILVLAGGCLVAALAGAAGLREAPPEAGDPLGDVVHPLRDGRIWRVSVGSALLVGAQMSVLGFTVLFLHGERGLSTAVAAGMLAVMQLIGAGLRIASGRWSDRLGVRIAPLLRLSFGLAAALAASAALTEAPLALLLPALVAAGALSLSWNGLSFTATAELAGRARSGAALGLQQTALSVAAAATPPVFASLVDASSWALGFGLVALLPLAGATVLRPLRV
ncbi:MAG TPA: MFS transporter [Gaiellaceae bacterium]|nr:MFS transporter [Gaiellaceae bacterium]